MAGNLDDIRRKKTKIGVGLNSGTSCDGIDAAVVIITGSGLETELQLLAFENIPYDPVIRLKIGELFQPETGTVDRICAMNFYLGELFAAAAFKVISKAGLKTTEVDFIGSHGQTIYHLPKPGGDDEFVCPSTLQIGEAAVIRERTGIMTVADFRVRDIAAGGQGAPLTPYLDRILFGRDDQVRIIQNIGGIGNLTLVGGGVRQDEIIAFDTGPGNMIIDGAVSRVTRGAVSYDLDGEMAARGRINPVLLDELLAHPYLEKEPPKTTGREEFGAHFINEIYERGLALGLSPEDLIATVTAFTVESIAVSYERFIYPRFTPDEIVLGGGGAYNRTLFHWLQRRLAPLPVLCHEDFGISSDAKEAILFAVLANETIHGIPANIPAATGSKWPVVLGKIVF